jgi:hypothetical protein
MRSVAYRWATADKWHCGVEREVVGRFVLEGVAWARERVKGGAATGAF